MKDRFALLFCAISTSVLAYGVWYAFGSDAFTTLSIVAVIVLTADNFRLRRQLRSSQSK